ncbi:hypothetical protein CVT23_01205 [Minwuia thermotolerans]|uniref:Bacterial transcriptional activator domain-containing protein n=2 Tax=Minwuia thermotolerans TaxID=2056226 RepID=A0A2M9G7L0_9PROT|nr:hypothetical protein CVT23_01205 [Minwuia thermotolerans]
MNGAMKLRAELLGPPRFLVGDRVLDIRLRKSKALLAFLCLNAGERQSRSRLRTLLWEDDDENRGAVSLRQTLFNIRKTLADAGFDGLEVTNEHLLLPRAQVVTDVELLTNAVRQGDFAAEKLQGEKRLADRLCEGLENVGETYFATLRAERQIVYSMLQEPLERHLTEGAQDGAEVAAARALLNLDPSHELACRRLMADRATRGDAAGAIAIYNELWSVLSEEFDTEPSVETQSLLARIKLDRYTSDFIPPMTAEARPWSDSTEIAAQKNTAFVDRGPVIVMGRFELHGETDARPGLAQALRHDLLSRLIRFREWSVLDQVPAGGLQKTDSVFELTASIQHDGDLLGVSINLKELQTERFLWSEYYGIGRDDVLEHQAELVARIALALNVHISADRLERIGTIPNVTLDLYDRLLIGQQLNFTWDRANSDRAADTFRSLIEEKPFFAPAYSALAQLINSRHIIFPGAFRNSEQLEFSNHLTNVALRLDPLDSRSHLCSGWSLALRDRFDEAYQGFRMAYELNENDPWTAVSAPAGFCFCGDLDRAARLAERALDRGLVASPLQWSYQVVIWFSCGDDARAIEAFERSDGGFFGVEAWYTAALVRRRELRKARRQYADLIERIRQRWTGQPNPTFADAETWLVQCFPIGDPETRAAFFGALKQAGLQAPEALHTD